MDEPSYPSHALQAFDWFGASIYTGLSEHNLRRLVEATFLTLYTDGEVEWFDKQELDMLNKPPPKKSPKASPEVRYDNRRANRMREIGERARGWERDGINYPAESARRVALGQILLCLQALLDQRTPKD